MSRQQALQPVIAVTLVMLFLVGCGSPTATPVSEAPAATSTPKPPAATPTPEPPTATPTPVGNLSERTTIVLGPAEVEVIKVAESKTSPVLEKSPQAGMKFVLVELKINKMQSGQELTSESIFLEASSGKQYGPPKVYGEDPIFGGKFEAGSSTISGPADEFNVFFEVADNEDLSTLTLSYR